MPQDFDPGHGYQDPKSPEEEEFEKTFNLNKDERKVAMQIQKDMSGLQDKFTFWMREHQANPKGEKYQFTATLKGDTLEAFMWLKTFVIGGRWASNTEVISEILKQGIMSVYHKQKQGEAAAVMAVKMMEHMPEPVIRAKVIDDFRRAVKRRKEVEDKELKESMGDV